MTHFLLADSPGTRHLLLGNEAIARGALEAGVGCVTCYPGTPSSEVPDTLFGLYREAGFSFEYSVNEKVALEVGGGAAVGGVPTLVTMKHVGLNVAADPLMSLTYIGTPGGLVILSADDPGCHSSQNEQDNRYYARLAGMPCFEPSTAQEAKDMTRDALLASARWQQPVMLRTTTRVNHGRGPVEFGPLLEPKVRADFARDPFRFVPLPAIARRRHPALLNNLAAIQDEIESSAWNSLTGNGSVGIVASGIARAYLHDALMDMGLEDTFKLLQLGISYPLPEKTLASFLQGLDKVLVLEELEPLLEEGLRSLCQKRSIEVDIQGKDEILTRIGEYSTYEVQARVAAFMDKPAGERPHCPAEENLPPRPPNLCPGCSHRAVYYAVRKVFGDEAVSSSDIGCYTLGFLPPLRAADFLFCMGSSISGGSGMSRATGRPVVAYIGDSTFFHSGVTGLINAVHNEHDLLVVILDNQTTAMTGHQPHPGVEQTTRGPNPVQVSIEQVVQGCGVSNVRTVKALNHKATMEALREFKELSGVRVLIAREPCVLFARRTLQKKRPQTAYVTKTTPEVWRVLKELACPAFNARGDEVVIDETQCAGCMLCVQLCDDIKARKKE